MTTNKGRLAMVVLAVAISAASVALVAMRAQRMLLPQMAQGGADAGFSTADENARRVVAIVRGLTALEEQLQALRRDLEQAPSQGRQRAGGTDDE